MGEVQFKSAGSNLGSPVLTKSNGEASLTTAALGVGSGEITAVFLGNESYRTSASSAITQTVNKGEVTVALSASPDPSTWGDPVTFTANVVAADPARGTPSGSATFSVDGTEIETVTLVSGSAWFSSSLDFGDHTIHVSYSGDGDFNGTDSSEFDLTHEVGPARTTTTVSTDPTSSVFGQAVTFTATVGSTGGTPAGAVTFYDDGDFVAGPFGLDASESATFITDGLSVGPNSITAEYEGDPGFDSSSGEWAHTVAKASTATALTANFPSSHPGQSVTFTAEVIVLDPGAGLPSGTVTFRDNGTEIDAAVTLDSNGRATLTTTLLALGSHTITAEYSGDDDFELSLSADVPHPVDPMPTFTALVSNVSPSVFGQSVTFTATVSADERGGPTPSGRVTFSEGANSLGAAVSLDANGVATLATGALSAGSHTILAEYSPDEGFVASTSSGHVQEVTAALTAVALSGPTGSVTFGEEITFAATVSAVDPGAGTPTGTVTFKNGSAVVGEPAILDANGIATITTAELGAGTHSITAEYSGDDNFTELDSAPLSQEVGQATTSVVLTSSAELSVFGESVTFTATAAATPGTPEGNVTFMDGGTPLGTVAFDGDSLATYTTGDLNAGTHTITARFDETINFAESTSDPVMLEVTQGAVSVTLETSRATALPYEKVELSVLVAGVAPSTGVPEGQVELYDGTRRLAALQLQNGRASLQRSNLASGAHAFRASYLGSEDYPSAESENVSVVVDARTGPEVNVNAYGLGDQLDPVIATGHPNSAWVMWTSPDQDSSGLGIIGQRLRFTGDKLGSETRITTTRRLDQSHPSLAFLNGNLAVAAWRSDRQDGALGGIFGQLYASSGARQGAELPVNSTTARDQGAVSVARLLSDRFVAAWTSATAGGGSVLLTQRFSDTGAKIGGETRIGPVSSAQAVEPAAAARFGDGAVLVWIDRASAGDPGLVRGVVLGAATTGPFVANLNRIHAKREPAVTGLHGGGFAVTWTSVGQDGFGAGVYGRIFGPTGQPIGGEFRVNNVREGEQSQPAMTGFPGGGLVIAWTSTKPDGSDPDILARRYDANGAPADSVFPVARIAHGAQADASVIALSNRRFAIAWEAEDDGAGTSIAAQFFSLGAPAAKPLATNGGSFGSLALN